MSADAAIEVRRLMDATGIGLAGIAGVWWLPAREPVVLPAALLAELAACGRAIFALFDAVDALYGSAAGVAGGLDHLLEWRVPSAIPRLRGDGPALCVRPDFQLVPEAGPAGYRVVATELEICPSTHGFAHAMELGYGLPTELATSFARLLGGRELLFVGAAAWSEFLFEQLAFCRALEQAGACGRVLYSQPLAHIAAQASAGAIWQPPMFGIPSRPPGWDVDLLGRIAAHGLGHFLVEGSRSDALHWPEDVGDACVFRFGYFDCFTPEELETLRRWERAGATMLNPTSFWLDSKALLAAVRLPAVRAAIAAQNPLALAALDRCIPETLLLEEDTAAPVRHEREHWVLKYAGYDGGDQAWGGRSLCVGAACAAPEWAARIDTYLGLPWPVVAQRHTPSARRDIAYTTPSGATAWLRDGTTRLRSFLLRNPRDGAVTACGSHLTVATGPGGVSESVAAVQAPVVFG